MLRLNLFRKPVEHPLKLSLDTIFQCADKGQASEILFEPQRVKEPTETEGIPAPVVPADSIVLFVLYRMAEKVERQLSYSDGKDELLEQLKKYRRAGWRVEFGNTEWGEMAVAQRV